MMPLSESAARLMAYSAESRAEGNPTEREEQRMRLELGTSVRCSDDIFGELADVVIDPITKRVTHLVVQPHEGHSLARLVPIELAEDAANGKQEISLRCTVEDVRRLAHVEEFAYLRLGESPASDPDWDVGIENVLALPYYEGAGFGDYTGTFDEAGVTFDRVPKGDVEIRRSSTVETADEHFLGTVDGFVVEDDHITHFVLKRGHLWGTREITIPIAAVAKVETDAILLSLSKSEVGELPAVRMHRWH
jgi:sporulation protein YlmC with PRC-barrel domain